MFLEQHPTKMTKFRELPLNITFFEEFDNSKCNSSRNNWKPIKYKNQQALNSKNSICKQDKLKISIASHLSFIN